MNYDCVCQHGRENCLCVPRGNSGGPVKCCAIHGDMAVCEDLENKTGGKQKMQRQYLDPGQEVDQKVRSYAQEHRVSYSEGLRSVGRSDPQLAGRYSSRQQGYNVTEDSIEVDTMCRQYMRDHGVDYRTALRAVVREAEEKAQEMVEERDRRARAYQSEFNIKSYQAAETRVHQDDPFLGDDETNPLSRIAHRAKIIQGRLKTPFLDAVVAILDQDRETAQEAAGLIIDKLVRQKIDSLAMPGFTKDNYPRALEIVKREHRALTAMWGNGTVSLEAIWELFPQLKRE